MLNLRGKKTKLLWQNPEYRKHMSETHKGKIPKNKGNLFKVCPICKKEFHIKKSSLNIRKFCSQKCYAFFKRGKVPWNKGKTGYATNKKGKKYPNFIPWNKGKKGIMPAPWNKAKTWSKEIRDKISKANKGRISWIKGKHHSPKTIAKLKNSLKGRKAWNKGLHIQVDNSKLINWIKKHGSWSKGKKFPERSGKNSPVWKGGITPLNERIRKSLEYKQWIKSVFKRDNYTCQKCFNIGNKLQTHHIKSFSTNPELRFIVDNGITLCKKCHLKIHSKIH
jgi:hypothetical protein